MKTTGLLGGSFNPAHGAHRAISLFAIEELDLDEYWWLVSPGNPLKEGAKDMAPLHARLASAQKMARRSRIKPTAIEQDLGTRFTYDTLRKLVRRYPKRQFVWIMGADNLAQFHRWKDWRKIARLLPIAVISRPGYDDDAFAAPAMAWLRRFVHPARQRRNWTYWSTPALTFLRYRPDPRSATAIRMARPHWHQQYDDRRVRDAVTHRLIGPED
ncbi:nicotinate-nucleotide adenylyltransferase [Sphingopyxis sp. BSNA05]|uniref:nicotinate-nucleotide adenylyltransferase n=1 Tax=Sphingomonadales TaxID=204457 RepID=UPI000C1F10B3|nr:nicotinate-nucleotide adenylyltransferase [Sphingorhabdus sp. YGSMI21]ATW03203.1 nicotinic acid mononucleotide adenylyltransferase [Sphingorhabdus sp. YGSMI21]NRD89376.1 nicotinate-nucleotide adenylyltransferase [Sphingopyxis sp. BSNA05]